MPEHDCTQAPNPVCEVRLTQIAETLDKLLAHVEGNGKPGLIVRIDRIEQREESRKWVGRALLGGVLGTIGTTAWALLAHHRS